MSTSTYFGEAEFPVVEILLYLVLFMYILYVPKSECAMWYGCRTMFNTNIVEFRSFLNACGQ